MPQTQSMPISQDPHTRNQVSGLLLVREAERPGSYAREVINRRYQNMVVAGYPACDGTYLAALSDDA
jgi:hypothetical protein